MQEKTKKKAPYNQYDGLEQKGVKIQWGSPSDSSAIPSGDFDIVYDNNGKDMDACKPLIDAFKVHSHACPATPQPFVQRRRSMAHNCSYCDGSALHSSLTPLALDMTA